jgi:hypothetical protein
LNPCIDSCARTSRRKIPNMVHTSFSSLYLLAGPHPDAGFEGQTPLRQKHSCAFFQSLLLPSLQRLSSWCNWMFSSHPDWSDNRKSGKPSLPGPPGHRNLRIDHDQRQNRERDEA